ncbi:nucleolar complex protein 3 homolog [Achroia grisella]|uniref:nucleolar complex protein 3 homolog n=1 Tax=Achroia grisella TaxID=688607 RepID=UPI0027D21D04|nr:nucleolar complex protein 3 homolog [Achroia grisella]
MAKKGKAKISKVKRNNQTTNKMKKQGKLKLQRHRTKVPKQTQKQPQQSVVEYSSASDSESGEEWADMLDDEEQKYILSRIAKQPQLLSNVPEKEVVNRSKKRKREDKGGRMPRQVAPGSDSGAESEHSDSEIEENYEKELSERPPKKMRPLLPIKTKDGLVERSEEYEESESEEEIQKSPAPESKAEQPHESDSDSGLEGTAEENESSDHETVTAVQLMAARRDKLQHDKLRIGALCSSLLESPEKKLKNLFPILYLMEERLKDDSLNLLSVRKLATLSAYEVFKDILPDYHIRHQDYSNVKLKKDTLAMYKYEKELLEFYKRYLQRLEKACTVLRRKKGDTRKVDESSLSLALVSLRCMCGVLAARPDFNYGTNIAQSVVPLLDCRLPAAVDLVTSCCCTIFQEDKKGDITLTIVRLINQLVRRRGERLRPAALDCLLSLRIRDVDMDADADLIHKKRQDQKHKKRIVNLSKKEKKRAKKLKEVERELLETEAQENEAARRKQMTEVTKTVFHIYFRVLKQAPHSKLLTAALDGLAKFTHVINLEYYSDLVAILTRLVADEAADRRQRLQCVRTVLALLAGAGDSLNVDPAVFHAYLYQHILGVHAGSTHEDAKIIVEAVWQVCSRARRVSSNVLQALSKRLLTASLQLQPHAALACLLLLHRLAQQSKPVASLLEQDGECAGSGRFDPSLGSPEHCNAHAAAAHELAALAKHFHPAVSHTARLIHTSLPPDMTKLTPIQVFEQYDGSQMAFKPPVPPPNRLISKAKVAKLSHQHTWFQPTLREYCQKVENHVDMTISFSDR